MTNPPRQPAKPTVFLGSSSEAVHLVERLVGLLDADFDVRPWNQVFPAGEYTLAALQRQVHECQAAIFVFARDDKMTIRDQPAESARGNVLLEYGMFVSRLGPTRVLILEEEGVGLPSDVFGLGTAKFPSAAGTAAAAQVAKLSLIVREQVVPRWKGIASTVPGVGDVDDAELGYAGTIAAERRKLDAIAIDLSAFSSDEKPVREHAIKLGTDAAPTSAYREGLGRVRHRFWTTTFLSSGFWNSPQEGIRAANTEMLAQIGATGQARRLFLLDQPPEKVLQGYGDIRILQRQLRKFDEVKRLAIEHRHLCANIQSLVDEGFEVKVIHDKYLAHQRLSILEDPFDSELAIYDDFRVDVFEGGKRGVIHSLHSYSPIMSYFPQYLERAEKYFDELWLKAQDIRPFLVDLKEVVAAAESKIDYETNWLAMYEYALGGADESLKTVELGLVEMQVSRRAKEGFRVRRYLDIGTCTGRYPMNLRAVVEDGGEIIGVDEDYDCVRFAQANVQRVCPPPPRIDIRQLNFAARETTLLPPFDLITCMLGTLSHFGWNIKKGSLDDSLQRALKRMAELLADDGLLFLGTWSDYAVKTTNMLEIYRPADKERLAEWTPPLAALDQRLAAVGLEIIDREQIKMRLDVTWCRRARQ